MKRVDVAPAVVVPEDPPVFGPRALRALLAIFVADANEAPGEGASFFAADVSDPQKIGGRLPA